MYNFTWHCLVSFYTGCIFCPPFNVSSSHLGFGHGHWYGTNTWSHSANSRPCKCTFPPWPESIGQKQTQDMSMTLTTHASKLVHVDTSLFANSDPHKVQWTSEPISFLYILPIHILSYAFHTGSHWHSTLQVPACECRDFVKTLVRSGKRPAHQEDDVKQQQPSAIWNYPCKRVQKASANLENSYMGNSWVIYTKLTWFNWINLQHFVNGFRLLRIYRTTEVPTNHQLIRQIRIGPGTLGWLGGEASEIKGCHMFIRIYSIYPQSFFQILWTSKFETFHSLVDLNNSIYIYIQWQIKTNYTIA